MDNSDPDGFDDERRRDVFLRLVAVRAGHERDVLVATMTPLEIADHDLAGIIEFVRAYEAGETAMPVTEANTSAGERLVDQLRAHVDELRGSVG